MTDASMTPPAQRPEADFDIGAAISATFSTAFSRFFYFAGITFVGLVLIYAIMGGLAFAIFGPDFLASLDGTTVPSDGTSEIIFFVSFSLVGMVFGLWLYNIIVRSAVTVRLEKKVRFGAAVKSGLFGIFPLIVIGIILIIPYYIGILLLIIPGLFLMAMFYVIVPVIVYEGRGLSAMGRSLKLTAGYRWPIMGYFVVMGILAFLIYLGAILLSFAITMPFALAGLDGDGGNLALFFVAQIVSFLVLLSAISILMVLSYIPPAIAYVRLREIKEGGGDELLKVFE